MRRSTLVHPHLGVREALEQRPAGPGVIEMNVSQRDDPRRMLLEHGQELLQTGGRTGIDDDVANPPGPDHLRPAEVKQINQLGL